MNTVLVTGASGFLGRHVARAWAEAGHEVVGLGHGTWSEAEWRPWGLSRWVAAEVGLLELESTGLQPDAVVHCAGGGSVGYSIAHPAEDFARSVGTLLAVLEFVRLRAPGARVVIPSSAAVYGNAARIPIPVTTPPAPVSPYGVHKCMVEDLCHSYGAHYGLPTAIVRFFSLYGAGLRKQLLWDACQRFARGEAAFMGSGREVRDWLHVEDAASLTLVAAGQATPAGPVANGGGGSGQEVRAVLERLRGAFPLAPPLSFKGPARPGDPEAMVAELAEARAWGWRPARDLDAGIADYAEWFLRGAP